MFRCSKYSKKKEMLKNPHRVFPEQHFMRMNDE